MRSSKLYLYYIIVTSDIKVIFDTKKSIGVIKTARSYFVFNLFLLKATFFAYINPHQYPTQ